MLTVASVCKHFPNVVMCMVSWNKKKKVSINFRFSYYSINIIKIWLFWTFIGNDVQWHPDGSLVAVALSNSQIKIYDRRANKLIQLYNVHLDGVNSIAFHPSGTLMITGSEDGSTKVLDLLEGRPIYTLVGHDDAVTAVAFSGDGSNFATASKDKQASVKCQLALKIHWIALNREWNYQLSCILNESLPLYSFYFHYLAFRLCCGNWIWIFWMPVTFHQPTVASKMIETWKIFSIQASWLIHANQRTINTVQRTMTLRNKYKNDWIPSGESVENIEHILVFKWHTYKYSNYFRNVYNKSKHFMCLLTEYGCYLWNRQELFHFFYYISSILISSFIFE